MSFNSLTFLVFVAVIFVVHARLHRSGQNFLLLLASYVFYAYWDFRFTLLLFAATITDFYVGRKLESARTQNSKRCFLLVSILVNLGILGFFKYFDFFMESAVTLLHSVGLEPHRPILKIVLPVGISFYTFKTLSYSIDVYRGRIHATRSFIAYAVFVSFFPQLLAGPIERASKFLPQLSERRRVTRNRIATGLSLMLVGYFKKIAIADTLAPIVDSVFTSPDVMSCGQLWTGVYAYTFQIYGDFSGYTDIALGISSLLGLETITNFNAPYFSRSITEFWQRWHISLSTWFRDYLYIPLGGNRQGKLRTYSNLILTMLLCGLWHGPAWTFVLWGWLHGLALAGHRVVRADRSGVHTWPRSLVGWTTSSLKILLTFHFVALAWVFFRAPNVADAFSYFNGLFRFEQFDGFGVSVLFAGGLLLLLDVFQVWSGSHSWLVGGRCPRIIRYAVIQFLFISVVSASIANLGTLTPFIYFQF